MTWGWQLVGAEAGRRAAQQDRAVGYPTGCDSALHERARAAFALAAPHGTAVMEAFYVRAYMVAYRWERRDAVPR